MKVFVATAAGMETDDYSRTIEGELVRLPVTCDSDDCDCGQAMTGMGSGKATTTFTVSDFDISRAMYSELMWGTMLRDGWVREGNEEDEEWVRKLVTLHLDLADTFTPGVPLRLNGDRLYERR
jgi:hypothetical protein